MAIIEIHVEEHPRFSETQHCRADDCYTFSHTASWCGRTQPEFCPCPYDYPEGWAAEQNEIIRAARALAGEI